MHIRTQAVHAGQRPDPVTCAIATGIAQTTSFACETLETGADLFSGAVAGWTYGRSGNPTVAAFEQKLAVLERGEVAVASATPAGVTRSSR
jgi:methionine-gamma-lyase